MAYDALAESTALIERGLPEPPPRLSRRRRFAPLAVDVDGDIACTLFARRGVASVDEDAHVLVRRGTGWALLGGGSSGGDDDLLADRPAAALLGGHLVADSAGSVIRDAGRRSPWGARHVSYAVLRVSADVGRVVVGRRTLPVLRHGRLVVVWSERRPPVVEAFAADGTVLVRRRPDPRLRMPEAYRDHS